MAKLELTTKKMQIDKAQATIVAITASAVFVTVFSLVSARALWQQRGYQSRVITQKTKARDQLERNVDSVKDLVTSYQDFVGSPTNMLDGNPAGTGEKDGDNAKLVLDALPSKYDFPALTTSIEKIITDSKLSIDDIAGTDDEVAQSTVKDNGSPKAVDMPFQASATGDYKTVQGFINVLERSIRPFSVQKLTLSGGMDNLKVEVEAKSFYQPEKTLTIRKETVK